MVIFKCSSSGNHFQFHSQKMLFFLWVVWSSLCACSLLCMLGWMLLEGRKSPSKDSAWQTRGYHKCILFPGVATLAASFYEIILLLLFNLLLLSAFLPPAPSHFIIFLRLPCWRAWSPAWTGTATLSCWSAHILRPGREIFGCLFSVTLNFWTFLLWQLIQGE